MNTATIDPTGLPALPLDRRQDLPGTAVTYVVLAGVTVERLPSIHEPRCHERL